VRERSRERVTDRPPSRNACVAMSTWSRKPRIATSCKRASIDRFGWSAARHGSTNRGGPGRPKSALRDAMRESLEASLHVACRIADDSDARRRTRCSAIYPLLGSFRMGRLKRFEVVNKMPKSARASENPSDPNAKEVSCRAKTLLRTGFRTPSITSRGKSRTHHHTGR
jgi:hypothetical protein